MDNQAALPVVEKIVPHDARTTPDRDESMWSAFQNILTFISLYVFAGALHSIWSACVDYWVPSGQETYRYGSYWINNALAALIVSAPFFITLFLVTNAKYVKQPELKENAVKKKLNYFTLVITFIILLARTISAINSALANEFSANFGLNLLVTVIITGVIFVYYLYEVRFERSPAAYWKYALAAVLLAALSAGTLYAGFIIRGADELKREEMVRNARPPAAPEPITTPQIGKPADTADAESVKTQSWNEFMSPSFSFRYPPDWSREGNKVSSGDGSIELWVFEAGDPMYNECMRQSDATTDGAITVKTFEGVTSSEMCDRINLTRREKWIVRTGGDGYAPGVQYSYKAGSSAAEALFDLLLGTFRFRDGE